MNLVSQKLGFMSFHGQKLNHNNETTNFTSMYKRKIWNIFSFQTAHNTVVMKSNIYTVVQNSSSTTKHIYNNENLLLPHMVPVSALQICFRLDRQQLRLLRQLGEPRLRDLPGW